MAGDSKMLRSVVNNNFDPEEFKGLDGVVVPGGFGYRGIEGKLNGITYLRENNIPFLG